MPFILEGSGLEAGRGSQEVGQQDVSSTGEQDLNFQKEGWEYGGSVRKPVIRAGSRS